MTIKEFFEAYLGLWIETNKSSDQSTLDQCVDNWRTYNRKVIGAPDIFGNAIDFWTNYQTDFYDKIPNTPTGVPQLGDVIIWGTTYSKYGHIAICTDIANVKTFTSFDQNDPTGEPCHYQPHTYSGVLGWLRPKNQQAILGQVGQDIVLQLITGAYNTLPDDDVLKQGNLEGYVRQLIEEHKKYKEVIDNADKISDLEDKIKTLNEALAEKSLELNDISARLEGQERDNKDLSQQILEARSQRDSAIGEKKIAESRVEGLVQEIESLKKRLTILEEENKGLKSELGDSVSLKIEDLSNKTIYLEALKRLLPTFTRLLKR